MRESLKHGIGALALMPPDIAETATLCGLRIIVDNQTMLDDRFALVRRPREHGGPPDAPDCVAYVHAQAKSGWLPDEAAWRELFTQLWPGY
jgi:hypothetical protein